ncbi:hypothetical protein V2T44_19510 [Serratia ficaria]|uniref:hypothetical protein n=1 Tax=Serratia ficaria TaxID=61651 RepID=UPI002ED611C6|nr:hypothetical protein [Serratia ficaria]
MKGSQRLERLNNALSRRASFEANIPTQGIIDAAMGAMDFPLFLQRQQLEQNAVESDGTELRLRGAVANNLIVVYSGSRLYS